MPGIRLVTVLALVAMALLAAPPSPADELPVPAVVTSDNVRMRSRPSLNASILGKLDHGAMVTVLARSRTPIAVTRGGERNWWYQVETADHGKGWMYGSYVYLETRDENQRNLEFKMTADGREARFLTRVFESRTPDRPGQSRSLVTVSDPGGNLLFIHIPANLASVVHSYRNEDQWYTMYSDRSAVQALTGVSVLTEKNLVQFTISERSGAAVTYQITLTCSYDPQKRFFKVEFSETVPQ